jgi:hypothetical protein
MLEARTFHIFLLIIFLYIFAHLMMMCLICALCKFAFSLLCFLPSFFWCLAFACSLVLVASTCQQTKNQTCTLQVYFCSYVFCSWFLLMFGICLFLGARCIDLLRNYNWMFSLLLLGFVPSLFCYLALACWLTLVSSTFTIQQSSASVAIPSRGKLQASTSFDLCFFCF